MSTIDIPTDMPFAVTGTPDPAPDEPERPEPWDQPIIPPYPLGPGRP